VRCLLVQPVHEAGRRRLEEAGIETRLAAAPDMATVMGEIVDCDAAITRDAGFSRAAMEAGGRLKAVVSHGAGFDTIDIAAASELGILVANTPGANAQSVAELAVGLALAAARWVPAADRAVRAGETGFREHRRFIELSGKTALIVGWGAIGRATARCLRLGFGMEIVAVAPRTPAEVLEAGGARKAESLADGLAMADLVSLHVPLRPETRHMMDAEAFRAMKSGAIFVNTARAGLVDEDALAEALDEGLVGAAALDVHAPGTVLRGRDDVILSPHLGGSTESSLERTALAAADCVIEALEGRVPATALNADSLRDRGRGGAL